MSGIRTRFAPSPTGYLHIGGARTALFNWAYARRHGGHFVLRIEDTDRERSTEASEIAVLEGLRWLGIDWDEGPFRQSERAGRHAEVVEALIAAGRAYRCVCSKEELEERKQRTIAAGDKWTYDGRCRDANHAADCGPHVVRLRMPAEGHIGFEDLVFGPSGQDAREIGDAIIRRSDGVPLYHLAVVVDDADMEISHVIRGADHLNNTPLQLAIYDAMGAKPPIFAHVPLIVSAGGKKLSKRMDDVSVQSYREQGYLPEAVTNWLVRLGWSHGDQEVFSRDEIRELFSLDSVGRGGAQADPDKLAWLDQHYIKALPREALMKLLTPFLEQVAGVSVTPPPGLEQLVDLLRERSKTLIEMAQGARFALVDTVEYEEKAAAKFLKPGSDALLQDLHDALAAIDDWNEKNLETAIHAVRERHELGMGKVAQPIRVAITGTTVSPGIFETLAALGKDRTLARMAAAVGFVRGG